MGYKVEKKSARSKKNPKELKLYIVIMIKAAKEQRKNNNLTDFYVFMCCMVDCSFVVTFVTVLGHSYHRSDNINNEFV